MPLPITQFSPQQLAAILATAATPAGATAPSFTAPPSAARDAAPSTQRRPAARPLEISPPVFGTAHRAVRYEAGTASSGVPFRSGRATGFGAAFAPRFGSSYSGTTAYLRPPLLLEHAAGGATPAILNSRRRLAENQAARLSGQPEPHVLSAEDKAYRRTMQSLARFADKVLHGGANGG